MSNVQKIMSKAQGMKVKDLVPRNVNLSAENLSLSKMESSFTKFMKNYRKKYIDTNKPDPLIHVMVGITSINYLMKLPERRRKFKEAERCRINGEPVPHH